MFKWKVEFKEEVNRSERLIRKRLPLDIMKLSNVNLSRQFVISPGGNKEYTSRELVFKFYESNNCKIIYLAGDYPITHVMDLLLELPPIFIVHVELSLIKERFTDLSRLNILNAIYALDIDKNNHKNVFVENLHKVIESDIQFYWRG